MLDYDLEGSNSIVFGQMFFKSFDIMR